MHTTTAVKTVTPTGGKPGRASTSRAGAERVDPSGRLDGMNDLADASPAQLRLSALSRRAAEFSPARGQQGLVVQRYQDLAIVYADAAFDRNPDSGLDDKDEILDFFQRVQAVLMDGDNLRAALTALAAEMADAGETLSEALARNLNPEERKRVILTDFVPEHAFRKLVSEEGYLFEDYVQKAHGVYSHQLQHYIILQTMGLDASMRVREESLKPRWKVDGKYLWDRVVDGTNSQIANAEDLTVPDNLTSYVVDTLQAEQEDDDAGVDAALGEVVRSFEEFRADKPKFRQYYPPQKKLPKVLSKASKKYAKQTKKLRVADRKGKAAKKAAATQAQLDILNAIANEVFIWTASVGGVEMTFEWTGWRVNSSESGPVIEPSIGKVVA
ncbi:hypothetical protein [uncultured Roseobacter sp.]|uniref:hypothetical protein n=1 Tax=uncultured Roseobacter sp. TaxID=114847 RepID=UPI0026316E88|nr:hypothetical protein [uncultured Roseobacter sp.]